MSCAGNDIIYENCLEAFWELLEDCEFQDLIRSNFLSAQDQWYEKEIGRECEEAYHKAFDTLWKWDAEGLSYDIEKCVGEWLDFKKAGKIKDE